MRGRRIQSNQINRLIDPPSLTYIHTPHAPQAKDEAASAKRAATQARNRTSPKIRAAQSWAKKERLYRAFGDLTRLALRAELAALGGGDSDSDDYGGYIHG